MPTISIFKKDLESLLGAGPRSKQPVTIEQLEDSLMLVKGELKEHDRGNGRIANRAARQQPSRSLEL